MVGVLFVHPDLGIGGAERLVLDAALACQRLGHEVTVLTAHHDPGHCFNESKDGTIRVRSVGDWLPRSILGRCFALCAYIRMIYLALYAILWYRKSTEVIFLDQVSAPIPIFKLFHPVIFYCHFPDLLLTNRSSALKALYRYPIDFLEGWTTRMADLVLVNSRFTREIFHKTFGTVDPSPKVLYPSVRTDIFDSHLAENEKAENSGVDEFVFLSLNRFERKKQVDLAVRALALVLKSDELLKKYKKIKLIIAGGYDHRVAENVEYEEELRRLAEYEGISDNVTFMRSISFKEKIKLYTHVAGALIYTPSFEHFGIVPIEAMYCGLPVIAVDNGGPKETIINESTGCLVPATPEYFAEAMGKVMSGGSRLKAKMGEEGRKRVIDNFSFDSFSKDLDSYVSEMINKTMSKSSM